MAYRRPPEDPDLALSSTRADWNGPGFSPGRFVFSYRFNDEATISEQEMCFFQPFAGVLRWT